MGRYSRGTMAYTPDEPETELDKAAEAARAAYFNGVGSWDQLSHVSRDRWRAVARAVLAEAAPRSLARVIPSRRTDPDTAKKAAAGAVLRAGTQRHALLGAFDLDERTRLETTPPGLTDEQAARHANVSLASEYAKRCSELREAGWIEPTGEIRPGASGAMRIVSRITQAGRLAYGHASDAGVAG